MPIRHAPLILMHLCSHTSSTLLPLSSSADAIQPWTLAEQDEWIAHPRFNPMFHDCIGIVDATYIKIERPKDYQTERRHYSTYKKYHALYFIAITDRYGQSNNGA